MLHKEVHQCPCHRGRRVEEKCWDPQNGTVQLLQAQKKVVPVLHSQQIVVVFLQDTRVKGGHVCPPPNVLFEELSRREVAAKDKVELLNLGPAARASEDATVADHSAGVVVFVQNGRDLGEKGAEVLADGEDVFVAGVVVMH